MDAYLQIPYMLEALHRQAKAMRYEKLWFRIMVKSGCDKFHIQTNAPVHSMLLSKSNPIMEGKRYTVNIKNRP